jgi:hypothetical protein
MICKTVTDLIQSLNQCVYIRNTNFEGGKVYVCNLCGETSFEFADILEHLAIAHENAIVPDVDPSK